MHLPYLFFRSYIDYNSALILIARSKSQEIQNLCSFSREIVESKIQFAQ